MSDIPVHNSEITIHWPSVFQVVLSLVGALILWGLAAALGVMIFNTALIDGGVNTTSESFSLVLMAAGLAFAGILLLPSAGYGLLRILNKPNPIKWRLHRPVWLILAVLILVGLGYLTTQSPILSWTVLPLIHVLVIGLSVLWLVSLGIRGLSPGSAQRVWGVFGTGMVLAPLFSLVAEAVVIIGIGVLGISFLAQDPLFADELSQITDNFLANPNQPPELILEIFEPYWMEPGIIYLVLLVAAVLVPLIEEMFKTVGVWLLAGKQITPAQGFAAGVLSGAGFALFETLSMSAGSREEWSLVVMARIGTSIIHIVTTGITGWALAVAWRDRGYFRLGLAYFSAVAVHGLWNGMVVLTVILELWPDASGFPKLMGNIGLVSLPVFIVLLGGGFALLLGCNASLRRAIIPPASLGSLESKTPSENLENLEIHQLTSRSVKPGPDDWLAERTVEEKTNNGNHSISN